MTGKIKSKIMKIISDLFIGPRIKDKACENAILAQAKNVKNVWLNTTLPTFGVERVVKLFLTSVQFIFPALYIRYYFGKHGMLARKLANEFYTVIKVVLPILLLLFSSKSTFFLIVIIYFGIETVIYTANILFLQGIYTKPISNKRSILLGMLNYLEILLDFSFIYYFLGSLSKAIGKFDFFYFSVMTSATVGYGDITPTSHRGIVVIQIFITLFFTLFLLSYFLQNISNTSVWHKEENLSIPKKPVSPNTKSGNVKKVNGATKAKNE